MSYKGLWTNQDSVRNDSVVKQDLILKKNLAFYISYPSITSRCSGNEPALIEEQTRGNVGN